MADVAELRKVWQDTPPLNITNMLCAMALGVDFSKSKDNDQQLPVPGPSIAEIAKDFEVPRDLAGDTVQASREFLRRMAEAGRGGDVS